MITNNLSRNLICFVCCLALVCLALTGLSSPGEASDQEERERGEPEAALATDEHEDNKEPEPSLASDQGPEKGNQPQPRSPSDKKQKKRSRPKYEAPFALLGDVVDLRIDKDPGQSRITIVTNTPMLFEASEGRNGQGLNYLTIEIPNTRLAWSKGEQKSVEVGHGGVKDITLTQLYQPDFDVEAKIRLLPQARYNVYSTRDAKGIVIEVKEAAPEEPKEVVEEEAAEELPSVLVSIDVVDADIQQVLKTIAEQSKLNIVTHSKAKGEITVRLKDVSVETALDMILATNGLAYRKVDNTILIGPEEQIAKKITSSEVLKLKHLDAESAREVLAGIIPERSVQTNKETNSIVITAVPDKLKEARRVIEEMDRPVPQVQLNAKVIEVGTDATKELGINWSQGIGVTFREKSLEPAFGSEVVGGEPFFHFYNLARTAFEAKLKALIDKGQARILSSPRIIAMKDEEARIFIGDRVPYTVTTATGGVALTEVRFIEPGIKLHITPRIVNDDFVVMDVAPEVSYIYSFRGPQDEYPWVKTREAKANVRIKDGETLILGGLLSSEDKETISRVPFLSSIPVIGEAFKSTKLVNNDTELLIVVTPTIMKGR